VGSTAAATSAAVLAGAALGCRGPADEAGAPAASGASSPATGPATPSEASGRHSAFDPWVDVRTDHLRHNLAEIGRRVEGRPVLAVIKNNGYGAGVVNAARALEGQPGLAGFAVVKLHEAVTLRDAGIEAPVLLMGPFDETDLDEIVARRIMPMVYTPMGDQLDRVSAKHQRAIDLHVCVDTGIGRVGVPHRVAKPLIEDLARRSPVKIDGIMMTFTEDQEFDAEQLRRFEALTTALTAAGVLVGRRHAASSFALFQRPLSFLDMVRPGMAVFGVYSEPPFRDAGVLDLRPAMALKARVAYVKQLQPGDGAGYNRAYVASTPTWIATLPLGHVDGLPRGLVKGGRARVGHRLYPFIGSVSASHSMLEIGAEPTVAIGDEVTVFDWQAGSRPEDLGGATGSSVYDLTMHLNPLLPRRVV
jgi:alanine racemase